MRGFTLLEVMIALAILGGVVLTVITSFNYHLSITTRDREELAATLLARGKLEELEAEKKREAKKGDFAPLRPDVAWNFDPSTVELPQGKIDKLTLTVSWDNGRRRTFLTHYLPPKQ